MTSPTPLPIDPLLPDLVAQFQRARALVLGAPPGAGKTTRVPPALLEAEPHGVVLVAEPRRVAARAAARRVAAERGWQVGREVGFQVRRQKAASRSTRLLFVTGGVLLRRLQEDPLLEGVAAVVLDEVHERHLDTDLALALLREVREVREGLGVLCMSATLEAGPLAAYLGGCPVVEAAGRSFPVAVRHLATPEDRAPAVQAVAGVRQALDPRDDDGGDVLVFLPGAADIRRAAEALGSTAEAANLTVLPLHGDLPDDAQDRALAPAPRRKVVLATNVAESSLTVPGVTVVVDTGWVKRLELDPRTGLQRLRRRRISQASAEQRAGRAGRTAPGRVYRRWTAGEHHALPARETAAIRREDLAGLVLQLRGWGCADPAGFGWFEAPPSSSLARADDLLLRLGALGPGGVTEVGRQMRSLPLHPRLGRMLVAAHAAGVVEAGCWLAALASERDVLQRARAFGGEPPAPGVAEVGTSDLIHRWDLIQEAERSGGGAAAMRARGLEPVAVRNVRATARQLAGLARRLAGGGARRRPPSEETLAGLLLAGFPDRVAVRRPDSRSRYLLCGGRTAVLHPASVVQDAPVLLAHDVADGPRGGAARIWLATEITARQLRALLPDRVREQEALRYDRDAHRVVAEGLETYDDLVLSRAPGAVTDRAAAGRLLGDEAAREPRAALQPGPEVEALLARVEFLRAALPEAGLPALQDDLADVARELAADRISLAELRRQPLLPVLRGRLGHRALDLLEAEAPERLTVPSGSRVRLEYPASGPPVLAVKLQEVFGWRATPRLARGRVAVLLHLLAPNGRPAQITRDLESFWASGYADVRRELRGRYPKHPWPENPLTAEPTRRTRRRR